MVIVVVGSRLLAVGCWSLVLVFAVVTVLLLLLFVFLWNVCDCTKPNLAMLRAPEYSVLGADLGKS